MNVNFVRLVVVDFQLRERRSVDVKGVRWCVGSILHTVQSDLVVGIC